MSGGGESFDVLMVGLDQGLFDLVAPLLAPLTFRHLATSADVEAFLDNYQLGAGSSVLISNAITGMNHFEIGQALSSYFQGLHLHFVTLDRQQFEVGNLKKNGFTHSFLLPFDQKVLADCLDEIKHKKAGGGGVKKFKAVKLLDVEAGQDLPFEVRAYLPANNKYVVLSGSGRVSEKKVEMLKQRNMNSLFIDTKQVDKFYEFAADRLISLGASTNDAVSHTEKTEKLQSTVRDLFRSILDVTNGMADFETGRDLMDQSKSIVKSFVEKKTGLNLAQKLKEIMGEGADSYSHAQTVSTIACLLSMATEIGQPEDLAIAGLFHDLGITGVAGEISIFDLPNLDEQTKESYMQHPKASLNILREKRITLTPQIADIIEKHHERIDGKGFPARLVAHRIPLEAQLLAYADAFEYLSRKREGKPQLTPHQVHDVIIEKVGLSPEVLSKIERFLGSIPSPTQLGKTGS